MSPTSVEIEEKNRVQSFSQVSVELSRRKFYVGSRLEKVEVVAIMGSVRR